MQPECLGEIGELSLTIRSWQPVLGLGVTIFSEDHNLEKQELSITAILMCRTGLVIFWCELVGQCTGNISGWYFFTGSGEAGMAIGFLILPFIFILEIFLKFIFFILG